MISMTGYGYSEYQDEKVRFTLEIKSYNNRYLDLILNLPVPLSPLEGKVRALLGNSLKRGRVEVYLKMKELEEDLSLIVDAAAVKSYAATLREVQSLAGINSPLSLGHILSMEGVIKTEKNRNLDQFWDVLQPLFQDVLHQLTEDRRREGASTEKDILSQVALLESRVEEIRRYAPEMEKSIDRTLREKFTDLLDGQVDESRLLSEIAVQLVRFDINEEMVRLKTHFDNFRAISSNQGEPVGKKLDFLCQEINREINTIGSKSTLVDINRLVVDMKDSLEKVREQLRNVE
jgi:uncharacterized protein (TIGR00255 family)